MLGLELLRKDVARVNLLAQPGDFFGIVSGARYTLILYPQRPLARIFRLPEWFIFVTGSVASTPSAATAPDITTPRWRGLAVVGAGFRSGRLRGG